ncbi:hypothetical protein NSQ93_21875 [Bacillus sp. FSL W8-0445]|jgi:hypothetical protein|uniref:Uncharacterized protein n=1 Tax=Bacillus licheniformis TaxID=1402 RepID=A0AB37GK96_BACLI|nr:MULTISPECIES: hypothetical protein [Bacillus]MBJ7887946.1 hypothetical protein [Bacillaceae bacterium HSR45]AMR09493.1 hypothetical protein AB684_04680 [Bacillus licheniformis]AWV39758.1 hypothetical protein CD200_04765 [Bacillus licheniformis]AZN80443.1 hypothetical protein CXG95_15525 [Bacillus licheniformis]KUL09621.1 hypothetical protein LI17339_13800 [Bacillus licheniformis LMG 17339]
MFCIVTETEYYGSYGPAGVSYLRESKDGEQRPFLFPGGGASIKLDCTAGRYEIRNIDDELLFLTTVKNVYLFRLLYQGNFSLNVLFNCKGIDKTKNTP